MMIPLDRLRVIASNPHTSLAAGVYIIAKFGTQILSVWFPEHKEPLRATAEYIEGAAVAWGLLFAGDASKSVSKEEAAQIAARLAAATEIKAAQVKAQISTDFVRKADVAPDGTVTPSLGESPCGKRR